MSIDAMTLNELEKILEEKICSIAASADPAHDLLHFKRVVNMAKKICAEENAVAEIVVPAAWLHDLVPVPKDHFDRKGASRLSAVAAIEFLKQIGYDEKYFDGIAHAIAAHSFSANIEPTTLEAKVVQDADRLDGIGAIGIARCFALAGILKRPFYSENDPGCASRQPDDSKFTVDHFYAKLFKTAETMQTECGRAEGRQRAETMRVFLTAFSHEVNV